MSEDKTAAHSDQFQQIHWIPVGKISVLWVNAQRKFDPAWASQLAEKFDPDALDPLLVTKPNGQGIYHCVDGQHRRAAVENMWGPKEKVPCLISEASTPARAAKLFVQKNAGRKAVSTLSLFKVRVTAGDEPEVSIDKLVRKLGYIVEAADRDKSLTAVAALKAVYQTHGPKPLDAALRLLQGTFGMDPEATSGPLIRGYGRFMAEHGDKANWQRLKEVVAKRYKMASQFLANARINKVQTGLAVADAVYEILFNLYNKGLKGPQALKQD